MEKLSAWKVFKYTMAISAGIGMGKRILMAADAALITHLKNKFPDIYEKAMNKENKE